jgi:hypothetical protein
LNFNFGNVECTSIYSGGTFGYSGGSGDGNFSGKLVQFSTNASGDTTIENYFGFDDYTCITGEPIPTGDTCENVIISANLSYECIQFSGENTGFADVTLTVSGGQAPYTITGYNFGTIIIEDGSLTFEAEHDEVIIISVEDANGCTSIGNFIEIDCPLTSCLFANIETDISYACIGETNSANITLTTTGGQAPYTYFITNNNIEIDINDQVENGDVINVITFDANNCSGETEITIVCPINEILTCEDILNVMEARIRILDLGGDDTIPLFNPGSGNHVQLYDIKSQVTGLNLIGLSNNTNITNVEYTIENVTPNLINQYSSIVPLTIENPIIDSPFTFNSTINCIASIATPCGEDLPINLNISVKYTIEYGDLICELCGSISINTTYDCETFPESFLSNIITLSNC